MPRTHLFLAVAVTLAALASPSPAMADTTAPSHAPVPVYFGTYTREGGSRGIYTCDLDPTTGRLANLRLAAETPSPSFLAVHPTGRFVYAVNETTAFAGEKGTGGVTAFARDPDTGLLRELNHQPTAGGNPCFVALDRDARCVLVANYSGGNVAAFPFQPDGSLAPATTIASLDDLAAPSAPAPPDAPRLSRAHSIQPDPTNTLAVITDLGRDHVLLAPLDPAAGTLDLARAAVTTTAPKSGPRHLAFHPTGRFAYVIHEHASTVTAFAFDPDARTLRPLQTLSTLPPGFDGKNTTAEVRVHPNGRLLFGSNRGHNSIAAFAIDPDTGQLQPLGHTPSGGRTPRHFNLDPTGRFLLVAHQDEGGVTCFALDPDTGKLTPTARLDLAMPVCVQFVTP
mgnify:CR=1 FL=1